MEGAHLDANDGDHPPKTERQQRQSDVVTEEQKSDASKRSISPKEKDAMNGGNADDNHIEECLIEEHTFSVDVEDVDVSVATETLENKRIEAGQTDVVASEGDDTLAGCSLVVVSQLTEDVCDMTPAAEASIEVTRPASDSVPSHDGGRTFDDSPDDVITEDTAESSGICAEKTTPTENYTCAEETTPNKSGTCAEETTQTESETCAKETTPTKSHTYAKEPTPKESEIFAEETTQTESNIHTEKTVRVENETCAIQTTPKESDICAEEAAPEESKTFAEETKPDENETSIEETMPKESETSIEETTSTESETCTEEKTPTKRDTCAEETTLTENEIYTAETTPIKSDTCAKATTSTENEIATEETTLKESETCAEKAMPKESYACAKEITPKESDSCPEEATPTESETCAEETVPAESFTCAKEAKPTEIEIRTEETAPVKSDTCAKETTPTESETGAEEVSSQHLLDDSYTEESDTISEYPATTESSGTISSPGADHNHCSEPSNIDDTDETTDYDAAPDKQTFSSSRKQMSNEDAVPTAEADSESTSNDRESAFSDSRTREMSKTVQYKEKKSSSSDVTSEQLVEETVTAGDGITVTSHELEKEHHQKEKEESLDMKASIVVIGGRKMEEEERIVKYEEAESVSKESSTEEEVTDIDGKVLGLCQSKHTKHTLSTDSHFLSSKKTGLSSDVAASMQSDVKDMPEFHEAEAFSSSREEGKHYDITSGGTTLLSDISEADETDLATSDNFDIFPEGNSGKKAMQEGVISDRDECAAGTGKRPSAACPEQSWAGLSSDHTSTDDEGIFSQQEDAHQSDTGPAGDRRHVNTHHPQWQQSGAKSEQPHSCGGGSDKVACLQSVDVLDSGGPAQSQPCLPGLQDRLNPTGEDRMAEEQGSVSEVDSCRSNEEGKLSDLVRQEQTRLEEKSENLIHPLPAEVDDGLKISVDTVERYTKTTHESSSSTTESSTTETGSTAEPVSVIQRQGADTGDDDFGELIRSSMRTEKMVHTKTSSSTNMSMCVDTVQEGIIDIVQQPFMEIVDTEEEKTPRQDNVTDLDSDSAPPDDNLKQVQGDPEDSATHADSQDKLMCEMSQECLPSGVDRDKIDSGDISDKGNDISRGADETKLGVYTDDTQCDTSGVTQLEPDGSVLIKPAVEMIHQAGDNTEGHQAEEHSDDSPQVDADVTPSEELSPETDDRVDGDHETGTSGTCPDMIISCKDNNHSQPAVITDANVTNISSREPVTPHREENKAPHREENKPPHREENKAPHREENKDPHREENKPTSPVVVSARKGRSLVDLSHFEEVDDFVGKPEEGGMKKADSEAGRRVSRRDIHKAMRTLKEVSLNHTQVCGWLLNTIYCITACA